MAMVNVKEIERLEELYAKLLGQGLEKNNKKMDKDTRTAESIIWEITGGDLGMLEYDEEYRKRYLEKASPKKVLPFFYSLSQEEKEDAIDCFIKELQNPITKRGDLYEDFIKCCGTDVKKLRKGVREIVEELTSYFGIEFGNRDKYVQELLDYAKSLSQGEAKANVQKQNEEGVLPQIQHMKHLLEIMERGIKGTSTDQDAMELKENAQSWKKDVERLAEMVTNIDMDAIAN